MNIVDLCPRCHLIVPQERMSDSPIVCSHCGYLLSNREKQTDLNLARQFRRIAVVISVGLIASFIHLVTWDHFFLEIIPLKIKQWTGVSSSSDMLRLAEICLERKNPKCSESALIEAYRKHPKQIELMARLGKVQYLSQDYTRSAYSLQQYFSLGGRNIEAAYQYARSLEETGRIKEAADYYDYVIKSKDEKLQVSVTQKYIQLLRNNQMYARAIELIESIRRKGSNTNRFLDAELLDLKKKINSPSGV